MKIILQGANFTYLRMFYFIICIMSLCYSMLAHNVYRNIAENPNMSSKYSVAGVECWFEKRVDHILLEDNDITIEDLSLEECQELCVYTLDWVCLSIKYTELTQICELSSIKPNIRPEDMAEMNEGQYWEKVCSEEMEEAEGMCPEGYFSCKDNGVCIESSLVCDGESQCYDGSDEENCEESLTTLQPVEEEENQFCWGGEFRCPGTTSCLSKVLGCDGQVDCPWGEDERGCPSTCEDSKDFGCRDSKRCISNSLVCNSVNDCLDNTDEVDCAYHCRDGQLHCKGTSQCIPEAWACDGERDCDNGADELNCKGISLKPGCKQQEFMCKQVNVCIYKKRVCDGHVDCPDGSDEADCLPAKCPRQDYLCPGTKTCIPKFFRCDYDEDCPGGEDELDCGVCHQSKEFTCWTSGRCIPLAWTCNGYNDCPDGSDERDC